MPTLTGTYVLGDRPSFGTLDFAPSVTAVSVGEILLPAPRRIRLDHHGSFSIDLPATDDPAYHPSGWLWQITENVPGGRFPWCFELTGDTDLSMLSPITPTGPYSSYATLVQLGQHEADTTAIHGIADTSQLVLTTDTRLTNERVPVAGSVTTDKLASTLVLDGGVPEGNG